MQLATFCDVCISVFMLAAPFAPIDITVGNVCIEGNSATVTMNIVQYGTAEVFRPQYYDLSIIPQPLALPASRLSSVDFEVTLDINILYTFNVTSVSCNRMNSFSKRIQIRKLYIMLPLQIKKIVG